MKIILAILITIALSSIIAENIPKKKYRILGIFPLNGKSHWVMTEKLVTALAERGHQVDVVSHFPRKTPLPNYTDISIKGSIDNVVNNVTFQDVANFGGLSMKYLVQIGGNRVCALLQQPKLKTLIEKLAKEQPYDLIITELFVAPCYLGFGRFMKVPMIGVITSSFHEWLDFHLGNPINTAVVPGIFSMYTAPMTFTERFVNTLTNKYVTTQMEYYMNEQVKYVKEAFGIQLDQISELYKDLSLVLVNSHHSLSGVRAFTPAIIEVGGLHLKDDNDTLAPEVQKWLDESKDGCIYFTFGSMVRIETFPEHIVKAFYEAFEKIAPIRVLMKVARKEDLLPGLPKNVMTQSWFPQIAVLKHKNIRAFITHGGLMGTQEAVYCGVPLIAIPLFGDQRVNANMYVRKNVAVQITSMSDLTEKNITNALNTVLKDPSYRENAKKLRETFLDRPMSPVDTAVYWVEYTGRHGNILQSPAIHLNWWQLNLLDVYGVMALVLLVFIFVLHRIVKFLKNAFFPCKYSRSGATIDSKKQKKDL